MLLAVAAAVLGGLVGVAELLSRYRDSPGVLFAQGAAWAYIGFNAAASAAALGLVVAFDWTFGVEGETAVDVTRVLVAGFGSVALFRSNLFIVKAGDENIGAGPSLVLASLLGSADRAVDREQGQLRADLVGPIMRDVTFEAAKKSLVSFALTALVSVPLNAREELRTAVEALDNNAMIDKEVKSQILGLMLIDVVGVDVLTKSVQTLKEHLAEAAEVDLNAEPEPK